MTTTAPATTDSVLDLGLDSLRGELLELGTATLYEASGFDCFLPHALRPAWDGATVVGTAFPIRVAPGDNLPIHLGLREAGSGDVLVVDAAGSAHGYWGEVLAVAAQVKGVAGLVIDGGVRDTTQLAELGFPAFSRWIAIEGTLKDDAGSVGEPVQLGAATVTRGDVIVADRDGIVAIPAARLADVLGRARERAAKETTVLERLRRGENTMDIYGFAPARLAHASSTPYPNRTESVVR